MKRQQATIAERVLLMLSRSPDADRRQRGPDEWALESALDLLETEFPGFSRLIPGNSFLDYGCGKGWQVAALARAGASRVVGIDTSADAIALGQRRLEALGLSARAELGGALQKHHGRFDYVISQNSLEHIAEPERALDEMIAALKPGGRLLITFGPPWYAPYGAHTSFFTSLPWVHLLFPEAMVMSVRGHFRADGARRYEEVGLNRMSVGRFEALIRAKGLVVEQSRYRCVRRLDFFRSLPWLREAFINHVSVALRRSGPWLDSLRVAAERHPQVAELEEIREAATQRRSGQERQPLHCGSAATRSTVSVRVGQNMAQRG